MNGKKNIILVVAVVAIVVIIIYFTIQNFHPDVNKKFGMSKLEKLDISKLETGDLIFMSGETYGENVCKFFTNCEFSHVGVILKECDFREQSKNSKVYIIESDLGQKTKSGPRILLLEKKLKLYHGSGVVGIRKCNLSVSSKELLQVSKKYFDKKFDNKMMKWWFSDSPFSLTQNFFHNPRKLFCSELVANVLCDLQILKTKKRKFWFSPKDFLYEKILNNKVYEPPQFFNFKK